MAWRSTSQQLIIVAGGLFASFAVEKMVLEDWPAWVHATVAAGCFALAWAMPDHPIQRWRFRRQRKFFEKVQRRNERVSKRNRERARAGARKTARDYYRREIAPARPPWWRRAWLRVRR